MLEFHLQKFLRNIVNSNDMVIHENISIAAASHDANDPETTSGLATGNEAEKILGATKINNNIMFIIKR